MKQNITKANEHPEKPEENMVDVDCEQQYLSSKYKVLQGKLFSTSQLCSVCM